MGNYYKTLRLSAVVSVLLAGIVMLTARSPKPSAWDRDAALRKADYVFMAGISAFAQDSNDLGLRLLSHARQLAPNDAEIAAEYASARLSLLEPDTAEAEEAFQDLLHAWRLNPSDYIGGRNAAAMAGALQHPNEMIEVWSTLARLYPSKTDPALELSRAYLTLFALKADTTAYNRSLSILDSLERNSEKSVNLTSQKLRALAIRKDSTAMMTELQELVSAMPADPQVRVFVGDIYTSLGADSLALLNFRQAIAIDSTQGLPYLRLANLYNMRGNMEEYDKALFNALERQNIDYSDKHEMMREYVAEMFADTAEWPRIEHLFGVLQRVNPGEPQMHLLYSAFEATRSNFGAAREQAGYAVALDPDDSNALIQLIQMDLQADSLHSMLANSLRGTELFTDNFYFPIMASVAYGRLKRYDEAIALLKNVDITDVKNKKAVGNLLTTLGDTYTMAGDTTRAIVEYERALSYDNENYMAYNNLAYFMAEADTALEAARKYASFAVLSDPENPTYLDTYAWVYFKLRDFENARKYIDQALQFSGYTLPGDTAAIDTPVVTKEELSADVLSHAGDIYFMAGQPEVALQFWRDALALKPEDKLLARKVKHKTFFYE